MSDDNEREEEPQNADATFDCPSDESSKGDDDDDGGADPEYKLFEKEAENEDCGDDEEKKDTPALRNGVRQEIVLQTGAAILFIGNIL